MMLHILNQSPFHNRSLEQCLSLCAKGDSLLFIEDGVYAANYFNAEQIQQLSDAGNQLYLLKPDVEARGINPLAEHFTVIDDAGFVDLTVKHPSNQSWF